MLTLKTVDTSVSTYLNHTVQVSVAMLVEFGAIFVLTPSFFIIGILVAVVGGWCGQIYIKSQLSVKREMSNARAPVLGHFGAAMAGLSKCIRLYELLVSNIQL